MFRRSDLVVLGLKFLSKVSFIIVMEPVSGFSSSSCFFLAVKRSVSFGIYKTCCGCVSPVRSHQSSSRSQDSGFNYGSKHRWFIVGCWVRDRFFLFVYSLSLLLHGSRSPSGSRSNFVRRRWLWSDISFFFFLAPVAFIIFFPLEGVPVSEAREFCVFSRLCVPLLSLLRRIGADIVLTSESLSEWRSIVEDRTVLWLSFLGLFRPSSLDLLSLL